MRRILTTIAAAATVVALSASVAFAGGGVSGIAKGHGQAVSDVARAVDYVSGKARGEAVSALAKQHGALVSAAARAQHGQGAPNAKPRGASASHVPSGDDTDEPGGLKDAQPK